MNTRIVEQLIRLSFIIVALASIALGFSQKSTIAASAENAQQWVVPAQAQKLKNPVPITGEVLTAAGPLYVENCARCHGENGGATGPEAKWLPEEPANLTDAKLIKGSSDGELFWKITSGRDPMPSFRQLSDTQRWQLVDYVRYLANRAQYVYLGAHSKR